MLLNTNTDLPESRYIEPAEQAVVVTELCFQGGKSSYVTVKTLATSPCLDLKVSWNDHPETQGSAEECSRDKQHWCPAAAKDNLLAMVCDNHFSKIPQGSSGAFSSEKL